jgi:hypothetical protein
MPTTQTPVFAAADQAKAYIIKHDNRVKQLSRMALPQLRTVLLACQRTNVYGGPVSKDEFLAAIIEDEFPAISQARDTYFASIGF